jgi:hypothetical protein
MNSKGVCFAALVVLIPAMSRAQGGGGAAGQGAGASPRLPAGVEVVVNRLADSARARGLPSDPLFAKAAEGALKGADSTRIVDAVRRLLGELEVVRGTLGTCAGNAELAAAASALHAGVTPAQLARVAQKCGERGGPSSAKPDRLVMPLVVLADLVARRVSADVAVSSLETLLSRSAPDAEFASLRTAIERDIASGASPDAAMRARSAAVARSLDGRTGGRPPQE